MAINLLFSIDDQFVQQLKTTLYSLSVNTKHNDFQVYVIQKEQLTETESLTNFCEKLGMTYIPIVINDEATFKDAPVSKRYPVTIYFRLLAHLYLPQDLERILYLDADLLCINDIEPLYQTDISDYLYAAASHSSLTKVTDVINKVRLDTYDAEGYYNSGVLLMNLPNIRKTVQASAIFNLIQKYSVSLLLPDQDVLNALYGSQILSVPDQYYNYDVRKRAIYETISYGDWNQNWLVQNGVLLHFCGKDKPWRDSYNGPFSFLYKHYQHRMQQTDTI